jgi:hypothetical protein
MKRKASPSYGLLGMAPNLPVATPLQKLRVELALSGVGARLGVWREEEYPQLQTLDPHLLLPQDAQLLSLKDRGGLKRRNHGVVTACLHTARHGRREASGCSGGSNPNAPARAWRRRRPAADEGVRQGGSHGRRGNRSCGGEMQAAAVRRQARRRRRAAGSGGEEEGTVAVGAAAG